jgi:hypothetical protein
MVGLPYELFERHLSSGGDGEGGGAAQLPRSKVLVPPLYLSHVQIVCRMWWNWQGTDPSEIVVDYMKKYYPPDWTYANFGSQFHADLYGEYRSEISCKTSPISLHFRSK